MRFVIKYPTRGRPQQFIRMIQAYRGMLSRKHPVRFVVSVDNDDMSMRGDQMESFYRSTKDMQVFWGNSKTKIQAINADMDKLGDYDILILASDDMVPKVKHYDFVIAQLMQGHFPNLDGCLHFNDGLNKHNLNTMPIAGRNLIDSWGYIYHPSYISTHCDDEFDLVTTSSGKSYKSNLVVFKHEWTKTGKDATYFKNEGFWSKDKSNFEKRKAEGFPK